MQSVPDPRSGTGRVLAATPFPENRTYPLDMMENVIGLHLNHKADWNPLYLFLGRMYDDRAIPCIRRTFHQLNDMRSGCLEE
jgi:hypothetical protein